MPDLAVDGIIVPGQGHPVCQDYVLAFPGPPPRIIVCDGCSSSPHTDVGARLLAWSLNQRLLQEPEGVERNVTEALGQSMEFLGRCGVVNSAFLDATVLWGIQNEAGVSLHLLGDGVAFSVVNGELHYKTRSYVEEGTGRSLPPYPSYIFRYGPYHKLLLRMTEQDHGGEGIFLGYREGPLLADWGYQEAWGNFSVIGLATDGLTQIRSRQTGAALPLERVLQDFTSFKTVAGAFLQRRMKRALQKYAQEGYYPYDDLGIAVILDREQWD